MILPRSTLILWCGLCLTPLGLLAAAVPGLASLALLAAAVVLVPPVLDAILAGRGMKGLAATWPALVRLTHGSPGAAVLSIANESALRRTVRVALPLPAELGCRDQDVTVELPDGARRSTLSFECLPTRRGRYEATCCYLGVRSPMGFWTYRACLPLAGEVRVYPSLAHERKRLAALFLNRGGPGSHAQRQIGRGRDFERLREYVQGDPYEEIHWKATGRRARPITKVFQLERTQEVYVVIDGSRLSARPATSGEEGEPAGQTSLDRYIAAAMVMGMVAERQGDRFGVITFSDRVDRFVRARNGKEHYRTCREAIYSLQSRRAAPDFADVFSFIRLRLRRRALLVLLTDLDDPVLGEDFARSAAIISRQHLVLVTMIQPPGAEEMFSHDGPAAMEDLYRSLVGHMQWARLRELDKVLHQRGIGFALAPSAGLCAEVTHQYLTVKKRQRL